MGRAEFVEKGDDRVKRSFCALLLAGFLKEEKKDNFDNNTWIINKAISAYEYDRAYMNVYGMTLYFSDTIPE